MNTDQFEEQGTYADTETAFVAPAEETPAKGNYRFPVYHRVGTDKKTGQPLIQRTIDPMPPHFKFDPKPITVHELYDAAKRIKADFPSWQFSRNLRYFMRAAGIRLGLAA